MRLTVPGLSGLSVMGIPGRPGGPGLSMVLVLILILLLPVSGGAEDRDDPSPGVSGDLHSAADSSGESGGESRFRFGLELRNRLEIWRGLSVKGPFEGTDDQAWLMRTKLLGEYRNPAGFRFLLELQDSRYWGSNLGLEDFPTTCPFQDELDVRRALFEVRDLFDGRLSLKVGRQSITYADKRVFGPGNWGNVGRYWWDAAKLTVHFGKVRTDVLWGQQVIREAGVLDTGHYPYHMAGLYTIVPGRAGEVHIFLLERRTDGIFEGEVRPGKTRVHSGGLWVRGDFGGGWTGRGTLALQRGTRRGDTIRAWGGNARIRRRLAGSWKPYVGGEISIGSGDHNPGDGVAGTFDGLFGSVSGAYGRMNLFSWKNLRDYQLSAGIRPSEGLHIWVDFHHFELDSARDAWYWCSGKPVLRDPSGGQGRHLGDELDFLVKTKLRSNLELFAGGGLFVAGSYSAGDPTISRHMGWAFLQLVFTL